ncbi:hypothetical protein [Streptomyces europaeiscabiei]|uniref:hypothetical protein n=1 Tax=Streptomyces europaeiscabiei TaxID=146819 RepID=UPI002E1791E1
MNPLKQLSPRRTSFALGLMAASMLTTALATPSVAAPAEAASSARAADTRPEGKYCTVVVEPVKPGEKASRVKSRTCSDDRATAAAARNSARTPLMSWYEHANYGGGSTMVFGDYGPCDLSGYVLDTGLWSNSISSFRTYSSCDGQQATLYNGDGPFLYWGYDTPYVGDFANDDIASFWVYNLP